MLDHLARYISKNKKKLKLSTSDLGFLYTIAANMINKYHTDICQIELAKQLNIHVTSVQYRFKKLKNTQLIIYKYDPNDKRRILYLINHETVNGI